MSGHLLGDRLLDEWAHTTTTWLFPGLPRKKIRSNDYTKICVRQIKKKLRPSSNAELHMSPTNIDKSTPVDSDIELNWPFLLKFQQDHSIFSAFLGKVGNKLCSGIDTWKVRRLNQSRPNAEIQTSNANLKYENLTSSFGRLRQTFAPRGVPHVQHDFFSSFNQSNHCFRALSLPLPVLKHPRRRRQQNVTNLHI